MLFQTGNSYRSTEDTDDEGGVSEGSGAPIQLLTPVSPEAGLYGYSVHP